MASTLELLSASPFFAPLDPGDLRALARQARRTTFAKGQRIVDQGAPATTCYMLISGAIRLSFAAPEIEHSDGDNGPDVPVRTFNDPGRFVGWSAMIEPYRYQGNITAVEPATLLAFDKDVLDRCVEDNPRFGVAFMHRLIWALGHRLRETRARLVARRFDKETLAICALLKQSADVLAADSPLHRIPYYLENRLTLTDAFRTLEHVQVHGDAHEQNLAALAAEILERVQKELAFYQSLQHVYEAVASAPATMSAEDVRRRCCAEFRNLFTLTDHTIKGMEKLPEKPGHIVVMNHLFNHPKNTLPNDFQLTMDSHFVSSMIFFRQVRGRAAANRAQVR